MPGIPFGGGPTLEVMRPSVSPLAEELYAALAPFAYMDEQLGWPMLHQCQAAIGPLQAVADMVRDSAAGPGWSALVDVDRCPDSALPWLAQAAGVVLAPNLTADQQRALIRLEPAQARGTIASIVAAAQRTLTGEKRVVVKERDGSAYKLTVRTFTSETPDSALVLAALLEQKPAGIVLDYNTIDGSDFDLVRLTYTTFNDLTAAFTTFADLITSGPTY